MYKISLICSWCQSRETFFSKKQNNPKAKLKAMHRLQVSPQVATALSFSVETVSHCPNRIPLFFSCQA